MPCFHQDIARRPIHNCHQIQEPSPHGNIGDIVTPFVERQTRYVMLAKVQNKDIQSVVSALIKQAHKLPSELYKSLAWDRGSELTNHKRFTLENENPNRLLRQYFPKGMDLSQHSQAQLNKGARQLNERPRKTLQFETPPDKFNQCVALTD